jgi:hypothetical protein
MHGHTYLKHTVQLWVWRYNELFVGKDKYDCSTNTLQEKLAKSTHFILPLYNFWVYLMYCFLIRLFHLSVRT